MGLPGGTVLGRRVTSGIMSGLRHPLFPLALTLGVLIAFLSLPPTLMLVYGSLSDAPLGVPGRLTLQH